MEFHAEMALPRVNSVRASEDEIGMDAIINQFIDRDFKFVFERVFGKCIDIGNGGEAGIDFNEGRICAEAHLNMGGRLVSEVFDGQVEAESLAVVGKAVGIVDAEIFVSEERPVGGNDLNVLIMSHFIETYHCQFSGSGHFGTGESECGFPIDDGCVAQHLAVEGKGGQGIIHIGGDEKFGLFEENGFGLASDIHFGRIGGAQQQARVAK